MSLSPQQERFCREYVIDRDGPAAYRRAVPKTKSDRTASTQAVRLLAKPEVAARVAELDCQPRADAPVTPEWVLEHLKHQAEYIGTGCSHSARVAALGLLMKHFGLLTTGAPQPDAPKFDLSKLTDDQQRAILAGLRLALGRAPSDGAALVLPLASSPEAPR